ncbi:putative N6-adenine-specific DNA methylase [Desulfocurvibacter africanus PCS]|uniref:Putative N6-adenine-specific DNA methylase n=1 Tax=Desulfocurvibacter africanus PCS TaxID=1262666 RepID=M5Q2U5_DESAF|nr:N6-adenine-specific DNA methylase [Desulfocurvibacter africanus]EMG37708.1 putative N6-adenine-specific DNA methylase [Desulfocurvibacter africanus PCS]
MFTLARESSILVSCPKGMAPYVALEMGELGYETQELEAGVRTTGTLHDCMRLNLHLRCGHRVHYRLKRFGALHPDMVYREVNSMPWEEIFAADGYLSVHSSVVHPTISDTRFPNLRIKDAVVDRFSQKTGSRPDSGPDEGKGVCLFLHWRDKKAELFMDTTGIPLPKRGYRLNPFRAPMQETLAASVIRATFWDPADNFVNPMCGSGTLAIEAALMARNIAPGLLRESFAFMHLSEFDASAWQQMRTEAEAAILPRPKGRIIASDIDPQAVDAARDNARQAGVEENIEFSVCDFRQTTVPEGKGAVLVNPEYGERLGEADELGETYQAVGDFLKQRCAGYRAGIFTCNLALAKRIGLRAERKAPFFSAKFSCTLFVYNMWEGAAAKRGASA